MKYYYFLFLLLSAPLCFSQSEPEITKDDPDYFFAEDVLYQDSVYLFACKKKEEKGLVRVVFDIYKGKQMESFKMTNIKPSNTTIEIFQKNVRRTLKKLSESDVQIISEEDKKEIQKITDRVNSDGDPLWIEEKDFIEKLSRRTSTKSYYLSHKYEAEFVSLIGALTSASQMESVDMIKNNIKAASISSLTSKEVQEADLSSFSSAFLFRIYIASLDLLNEAPEVGVLYVNKKIKVKPFTGKNKIARTNVMANIDSLIIEKVEIEFEYEQIANIKVTGTIKKKRNATTTIESKTNSRGNTQTFTRTVYTGGGSAEKFVFQNRIPISYSTKADVSGDIVRRTHDIRLLANRKTDDLNFPLYVHMRDVFKNDYRLLNKTENYSPADQVITIKPGEAGRVIKKEKVINILKAKVFSDFVGFDSETPNGLLQTEVSHRFYLNSRVRPFFKTYNYFGFFNSAMPKVTISKVESNNRILELEITPESTDSVRNSKDTLRAFNNTIDAFNHTVWSAGAEVNVAYFGIPTWHSVFYLNVGGFVRRLSMRLPEVNTSDTVIFENFVDVRLDADRRFGVNMAILYPEITWSVSPHPNFRASFNVKYIKLKHFNTDFDIVSDRKEYFSDKISGMDRTIWSFKFLGALRISKEANGELFFRTYFNYLPDHPAQNFFQAQVGYAFNIFDRNAEPIPRKNLEEL